MNGAATAVVAEDVMRVNALQGGWRFCCWAGTCHQRKLVAAIGSGREQKDDFYLAGTECN